MKTMVFIAACALCLASIGHAANQPTQLATGHPSVNGALPAQATDAGYSPGAHHGARAPLPTLAITRRDEIVTPLSHLPQLPEPEVFAMMLVGLVLIGYRVSRESGDKFT